MSTYQRVGRVGITQTPSVTGLCRPSRLSECCSVAVPNNNENSTCLLFNLALSDLLLGNLPVNKSQQTQL